MTYKTIKVSINTGELDELGNMRIIYVYVNTGEMEQ